MKCKSRRHGISHQGIKRLSLFSDLLQGVEIRNEDYRDLDVSRDAFLFFDPPYPGIGETLYEHIIDTGDLEAFLFRSKFDWMMTLNDSTQINGLFAGYVRIREPISYRVNAMYSNYGGSSQSTELLIINYTRPTMDVFAQHFGWKWVSKGA